MRRYPGIIRTTAVALARVARLEQLAALKPWLAAAAVAVLALLAAAVLLSLASCGGGSALPGGDSGMNQAPATGDNPAGGADNGGSGMDSTGDSGSALPPASPDDFTLTVQNDTYQVTDHVDEIRKTVEDLGDTVAVRATVFGAVQMYAFVATLDFDPQRYDPISLKLVDMERPELGLQDPNKLPGAKEYGRYWLIENRT